MIDKDTLLKKLEALRSEPIQEFVRKESEWNDYTEYVDAEKICKKPVVSCCVFTYNQEKYIRECLDSIVSQKADFDYEVLVCEDCSTDGTLAICREFQTRYPEKVRIIHANRNYYRGALNFRRGYELARGEYIAICEGDDYWCNDAKIQLQIDRFIADPQVAICYTNFKHRIGSVCSQPLMSASFLENCSTRYTQSDFRHEDFPDFPSFFATASIMLRRKDRLRISDSEIGRKRLSVGDQVMRMFMAGEGRVAVCPEICAVYRVGTGMLKAGAYQNVSLQADVLYVYTYFNSPSVKENHETFMRGLNRRAVFMTHLYFIPWRERLQIALFLIATNVDLTYLDKIRIALMISPFSKLMPLLRKYLLVTGRKLIGCNRWVRLGHE